MYQFITGPLLWLSFGICIVGLIVRVVRYIRGLDWKLDRVAYKAHPIRASGAPSSPSFTGSCPSGPTAGAPSPSTPSVFFAFHVGLVVTPLFLPGHAVIIEERWGMHWPTISMALADVLTITVIVTTIFIAMRRIALPEVRIVTTLYDLLPAPDHRDSLRLRLSGRCISSGITTSGSTRTFSSGELLLIAIPFTKLYHIVGFFLSRGQLGADFGIKRAYKAKGGFAW